MFPDDNPVGIHEIQPPPAVPTNTVPGASQVISQIQIVPSSEGACTLINLPPILQQNVGCSDETKATVVTPSNLQNQNLPGYPNNQGDSISTVENLPVSTQQQGYDLLTSLEAMPLSDPLQHSVNSQSPVKPGDGKPSVKIQHYLITKIVTDTPNGEHFETESAVELPNLNSTTLIKNDSNINDKIVVPVIPQMVGLTPGVVQTGSTLGPQPTSVETTAMSNTQLKSTDVTPSQAFPAVTSCEVLPVLDLTDQSAHMMAGCTTIDFPDNRTLLSNLVVNKGIDQSHDASHDMVGNIGMEQSQNALSSMVMHQLNHDALITDTSFFAQATGLKVPVTSS